jgi:hypothetical protein
MDLRAKDNISLAEAQKDTMAIWALVEEKEARLLDKTLAPEDEKTKTEAQAETIAAQAQSIKDLGDRQGTEADSKTHPKHSRQDRGETQSARSDCQSAEGDEQEIEQETEREPMNLCLTLPRPASGGVPPSRSHLHDGVKSLTTRRRDCQLTAARPVSPVSKIG